jgi:FkbH-like protein
MVFDMLPPMQWPSAMRHTIQKELESNTLGAVRKCLALIADLDGAMRGRPFKLGILRTFTVETMLDHLRLALSCIPCQPEMIFGELENIEQELFNQDSMFLASEPDMILILWRMEDLYPLLAWEADTMSVEQRRNAYEIMNSRIENIILSYRGVAPLFLSTFSVPELWKGRLHDFHRPFGVNEIVRRINLDLHEFASSGKISIFDFSHWISLNGSSAVFDLKMDLFARQPIAARSIYSFSAEIARLVTAIIKPQAKVLAIDLDHTLWGGVLGEDGISRLKIGNDYPGNIYRRIQQFVLSLKHRGVLLVLLSKNNLDDVEQAFDTLRDMPLKLEDFSIIKVNWKEKSQNLIEAARELNVGIDSFVFVDDQPFEREQMFFALPEVQVLSVGKDPLSIYTALLKCPSFDTVRISQEDITRAQDYQLQLFRKKLETSCSPDDFLKSLGLEAIIRPVDESSLQRAHQMLAKTNQFNLTTRRHSEAKLRKMIDMPGSILLTLSLSDRFGDQGIVGLCIVLKDQDTDSAELDSFLLSCRAIGRGAEDALWSSLLKKVSLMGFRQLKAAYYASPKNSQVSNLLDRWGMKRVHENSHGVEYTLELPTKIDLPDWININEIS